MATINTSLPLDAIATGTGPSSSGPSSSGRRGHSPVGERFDDHLERALGPREPAADPESTARPDDSRSSVADATPAMRRRSRPHEHGRHPADAASPTAHDAVEGNPPSEAHLQTDHDAGRAKVAGADEPVVPVHPLLVVVTPAPLVAPPAAPPAAAPTVAPLATGPVDDTVGQTVGATDAAVSAAPTAPAAGVSLPSSAPSSALATAPTAAAEVAGAPQVAAPALASAVPGADPGEPAPRSIRAADGSPAADGAPPSANPPTPAAAERARLGAAQAALLAVASGTNPDPTIATDVMRAAQAGVRQARPSSGGRTVEPASTTPAPSAAPAGQVVAPTAAGDDSNPTPGSSTTAGPTSASAFAAAAGDAEAAGAAPFDDAAPNPAQGATATDATGASRTTGVRGLPVSLPSLSMDLSDEGLGPLTLHASNGAGMLHLKLTAGDPAVGELLARAGGELRRDIEAGGTVVGSLDIGHGGGHESRTGHSGTGQWSSDHAGAGQQTNHADAGRGDGSPSGRHDFAPTRSRITSGPIGAPASARTSSLNIGTAVDGVDVRI